ncbi:hypothetical protein CMQ_5891 [Grosmannia clavigera kw1407]|uniref:Uncharacterized protein n=1 Tax=Grosmannia clavigera (strain kw1407 / UAMH 11150) TaxID=655863 RepID=F0XID9_GROCL|nr:uncharacterized protein CMQ_5891 [Grosmannia clavigera kw1407]EFX02530.1 hypothetical protein CMQ_5891 [Grosmannia clavigera kw1407]
MPRFSFPVPRRRQKQAAASVISPPLNKVQKFLGTAEINVDAYASQEADAARNWDARSDSCISISLSESSVDQDDSVLDRALSSLVENRVVNSTTYCQPLFDEESGVLPRNKKDPWFGDIARNTPDERSTTDASSLRRQQSSSTITSYYDKSKVPLIISQQTSSSAMAKGLPQKASDLLDISGTIANDDKQKSRPPKLDLSNLFPRQKPSNPVLAVSSSERGFVLGPDVVTRSPSFLSSSRLEYAPRHIDDYRNEKKLQKRPSKGLVRRDPTNHLGFKCGQPKHQGMSEQEAGGLQNLYEHYEQMSIRDTIAQEHISVSDMPEIMPEERPLEKDWLRKAAISQIDYAFQLPKKISFTSSARDMAMPNLVSIPRTDKDGVPGLYSPVDCSESVSSRQTRTSKASRQTSRSLLDADLQQTSVLSLSSDSEDGFLSKKKVFVPAIRKSLPTKKDTQASDDHQSLNSRSASFAKKWRSRPRSTEPVSCGQNSHMSFLSVKSSPSADRQPRAAKPPCPSAASVSTAHTAKHTAVSLRSSSHTSRASASSSNTTSSLVPPSYTVQEARAITLVPAQGASCTPPSTQDGNLPSDQMTPPLSPTSVEFCLRPDFDQGSVYSGHSFGTVGSSRSGSSTYRHVMTVTRQEELLLEALRRKKMTMREAIISQYEKSQEQELAVPRPPRRCSSNSTFELQAVRLKSADRSSASSRDLPLHFEGGSTVGGQSVHIFDGEQSSMNYSMELDDGCSGSVESSDSYLFYTPADPSPIGPPATDHHENRALRASMAGGRHGTKPHRQVFDDMQFHGPLHSLDDSIDVHILDERGEILLDRSSGTDEGLPGIPRPDSPLEAQLPLPRKKRLRISAVGRPGMGPRW